MTDVIIETVVETVYTESIEVHEIGFQGPPGIRGETGPAGGSTVEATAGEDLSGYRAVRLVNGEAFYCDGDNALCAGSCIGVTKTAALTGATVDVQGLGKITDPTLTLAEGPLFVGANGVLSATPGTAFVQEIARATSTTSLFVNIQPAILKV
jgi:hypothetical protein